MDTVRLNKDHRITLPKAVREAYGIRPGQKVQVTVRGGQMVLEPLRSISDARGVLKGMDAHIESEPDRF